MIRLHSFDSRQNSIHPHSHERELVLFRKPPDELANSRVERVRYQFVSLFRRPNDWVRRAFRCQAERRRLRQFVANGATVADPFLKLFIRNLGDALEPARLHPFNAQPIK
jgi:hypothetical protein